MLNLFYASVLEFRSTKIDSFVVIELSRSADFRFAVWQSTEEFSSVVIRKFHNKFVLVRDSGLYLFAKESLQRTNPSFRINQLY